MMRILIIGATSAIAIATARLWADQHAQLFLVGRDAVKLKQVQDDLMARGASKVDCFCADLNCYEIYEKTIATAVCVLEKIDMVLIAHGVLSEQSACEQDMAIIRQTMIVNAVSVMCLLTLLANIMMQQKYGAIVVIASVAGDRGRFSNYVYGSAKAAVATFCEGLQVRLHKANVSLVIVKPGFVKTPMTAHLSFPNVLTAKPQDVAKDILKAVTQKKDTIYTPWFWRWIMMAIRFMPTFIYKKLSI